DESQKSEVMNTSVYDASPQSDRLKAPAVQYTIAKQAPRILKPRVAFEMADILRDVVQRGTAVRAKALGRDDIGGKTGTTNDAKDAWFAGFHPTNATVVWMGFDQPSTMGRREYGGVAALPVWMDFMKAQLKDTPRQWVSINNRSKSQKQKQRIIEMTDDGIITDEDSEDSAVEKPVKTQAQQRRVPVDTSADETNTSSPARSTNRDGDTVPQNPLSVTPVDEMPPMPE
ncbi:MAG: penicillin-binding protein 1A, partial [Psychrobacter sp.]|nr:penicillin-binding protein 1A [Psychrobacter sp.]